MELSKLNELNVQQLIDLGIVSKVCVEAELANLRRYAYDYGLENTSPYEYFCKKGMIQSIPIDLSALISDYLKAHQQDLLKYCMITSKGRLDPVDSKKRLEVAIEDIKSKTY